MLLRFLKKNKIILFGILIISLFFFEVIFLGHTIFPKKLFNSYFSSNKSSDQEKIEFMPLLEHLNKSYPHYRSETGDIISLLLPFIEKNREEIIPLWNKNVNSGIPHFANGQSSVLNPANLFFRYFDPFKSYGLKIVFLTLIGFFGMYQLVVSFKISHFSALCSALTYCFCIYSTGWMHNISIFGTIVIIPWFYIFYVHYLNNNKLVSNSLILCSTFYAIIIFMGYFPAILQIILLMIFSSIIIIYIDKYNYSALTLKLIKKNTLVIFFGSCLGGIQLLPALEMASQSGRLNTFSISSDFTFQPILSLLSFFFYRIFGFPTDNAFHAYTTGWQYSELGIGYIGTLSMGIIIYYLFTYKKKSNRNRFIKVLFLSITIFVLLAKFTPLHNIIPFQSIFKIHRLTALMTFSGCIILGLSIDHIIFQLFLSKNKIFQRLIIDKIFGIWLTISIILSIFILCGSILILEYKEVLNIIYEVPALYVRSRPPAYYFDIVSKLIGNNILIVFKPIILNFLIILLPFLLFKKSVLIFFSRKPLYYFKLVFLFILVLDLFLIFHGWNETVSSKSMLKTPKVIEELKKLPPGRVIRYGDYTILPPNLLSFYNIQDTQGFVGLSLKKYQDYYKKISPYSNEKHNLTIDNKSMMKVNILQNFAVNYIISSKNVNFTGFKLLGSYDNLFLYRSINYVSKFKLHDNIETIKSQILQDLKLKDSLAIEKLGFINSHITNLKYTINKLSEDNDNIVIEVNSNKDAILFASIPNDKNWKISIDGEETDIYFSEHAFLNLIVEKGIKKVKLTYHPTSFFVGKYLTILTLILISLIYIFKIKKYKIIY